MKQILLGVILTAGAVLAQSTGTAPASSPAKPAVPATSAPATAAPGTKAPVKKHSKSNKPATAAATKPAATPAAPAAPASK